MLESLVKKERKLSKRQSEIILVEIQGYADIGHSLSSAIRTLAGIEKGQIKEALNRIDYAVNELNERVEIVMQNMGIVNETERFMLAESKNLSTAIDEIISMRSMKRRFEGTVIRIFAIPVAIIIAALGGLLYLRPLVLEKVADFKKFIQMDLGAKVDNIDLPFYLESDYFLPVVTILIVGIFVGTVAWYIYYYKNKTEVVYRVLPIKAYDDIPVIFKMMLNLHEAGLPFNDVMDKLADNIQPQGLRRMFFDIKDEVARGGAMYVVLERYHFPADIMAMVKANEVSMSLWKTLDRLVLFSQNRSEALNKFWLKMLASPVMWASLSAVTFIGVSLLAMFIETSMMLISTIQSMMRF